MKTKNTYLTILFSMVFAVVSFSQETNFSKAELSQILQLNSNPSAILNAEISTIPISEKFGNVLILNQKGNNQVTDLRLSGNDSQTINQLGDNNYYDFINYYNNVDSNFNVLQQGKSNSLHIYGENSIIKNLSIVQKSSFKTITIVNF